MKKILLSAIVASFAMTAAAFSACDEKHGPVPPPLDNPGDPDKPKPSNRPGIVAHRGFHTTSPAVPHNSVASFTNAQNQGFYAAEADFYVTIDDVVVSYHDTNIPDIAKRIDLCTYDELKDVRLANNEPLPLFEDYIEVMEANPSAVLIVEIKDHDTAARNNRAADLIAAAVKEAGFQDRVEYIAFNYNLCKYLAAHPNIPDGTTVGYLNTDISPSKAPSKVFPDGINCIDYNAHSLKTNPHWVQEAHDLGMVVNVWTVNTDADMKHFIDAGVDFITTDYPQTLKALYNK